MMFIHEHLDWSAGFGSLIRKAKKRNAKKKSYSHAKLRSADCGGKCSYRCSGTSHRKPCMFLCIKCCTKCHCVPPGTYTETSRHVRATTTGRPRKEDLSVLE
ncbi:hypothetical protein GIB67_002516 [Kingdonia uniflora]|uniref:Uncharacterized protein n=1 Tax=Kingdonia uniflora TaxID=39325 RepID=A0A7J7N8F2_9MAGN|nr:hypothetical protein GIB67_002516 [Kingdonia uniflora]